MHVALLPAPGLSKYLVGDTVAFWVADSRHAYANVRLKSNLDTSQPYQQLRREKRGWRLQLQVKKSGFYQWHLEQQGQNGQWFDIHQGSQRAAGKLQVDPAWLAQAVVYNVFVRFFKGKIGGAIDLKPGDGGTFDDVKAHLDQLRSMGINVLYFNPIHLIGEIKRKYNMHDLMPSYWQPGSPYSIKDYKSIDPELTYDKDTKKHLLADPQQEFRELIQAAHRRGMFVVMDLVFNHTAHDFVFQRIRPEWYLYKEDTTSLEAPYLYPEDMERGKPWGDPQHTVPPHDHGVWWEDAAQLNWEYKMTPASNQPPPNSSLEEMWEYFISIPQYWIRHFGVDGFRCDIAYRVPPAFWQRCIATARQEAARAKNNLSHDVVFIGEAYTNDLRLLQEAGFAAVYGDFSNKLGRPVDLKGYLDYMYNVSGDHFPHGSRWFIFPESHDFDRTPQKVLGDQNGDAPVALLANQSRWLLTATLPGIPLIFNGFEKIEWEPVNLFSYGAVDWERDGDLREFIEKVNKIRHHEVALRKGDYLFLETNQGLNDHTQLFAFKRQYLDQVLVVVVNMDVARPAGPARVYLPPEFEADYHMRDLLTGENFHRRGCELTVVLEPGQGHLFKVKFADSPAD